MLRLREHFQSTDSSSHDLSLGEEIKWNDTALVYQKQISLYFVIVLSNYNYNFPTEFRRFIKINTTITNWMC